MTPSTPSYPSTPSLHQSINPSTLPTTNTSTPTTTLIYLIHWLHPIHHICQIYSPHQLSTSTASIHSNHYTNPLFPSNTLTHWLHPIHQHIDSINCIWQNHSLHQFTPFTTFSKIRKNFKFKEEACALADICMRRKINDKTGGEGELEWVRLLLFNYTNKK